MVTLQTECYHTDYNTMYTYFKHHKHKYHFVEM